MPELRAEVVIEVIERFAQRLGADRQRLNQLNVFPVADHDTGNNMAESVAAIAHQLSRVTDTADVSVVVENAALSGRGNSGLIVGQFLAGFASTLDERLELDVADALAVAAARARSAVAVPVEGTMLTVADTAARRAGIAVDLPMIVEAVAEAVEATTGQLPVLGEHAVVDSGAAGLLHFFSALVEVASQTISDEVPAARPIVCDVGLHDNRLHDNDRVEASGRIVGYEIQFRVASSLMDRDELAHLLSMHGTDVVVATTADTMAAHLHVVDVDVALAAISVELEQRPGAEAISFEVEPLVDPIERPSGPGRGASA